MASRYQNITIDQGTDFTMNVVAYRSQSESTATLELSDYSEGDKWEFNSHLRKSHYHANAELEFTITLLENGSGSPDPTLSISLHRNNTAILVPGRYVYDVEITSPTLHSVNPQEDYDTRWRILEGIATVSPEATK